MTSCRLDATGASGEKNSNNKNPSCNYHATSKNKTSMQLVNKNSNNKNFSCNWHATSEKRIVATKIKIKQNKILSCN